MMLGTIKTTAVWVRKLFAPPFERRSERRNTGLTFRPRVESLEAREVPAFCAWTGAVDDQFDDPDNWLGGVPQAGDDVMFSTGPGGGEGLTSGSADCSGMQAASGGAYNSVTLDSTYTGRVTLSGGFTTGDFTLAGGTIDQPSSGTDITVTDSFSWTGGTLNSTNHLATLTLYGADATFAPAGGGTVYLGSSVILENGAEATMGEGTMMVNKSGVQFTTNSGSSFAINPGTLGQAIIGVLQPALPPTGIIGSGSSWTLSVGHFSFGGAVINFGTVTLMPATVFSVNGNNATGEGYSQGSVGGRFLRPTCTATQP